MQRHSDTTLALIIVLCMPIAAGCGHSTEIIDKRISFSESRIDGTLAYISQRYNIQVDEITIVPRMIVLHWTAIDDADVSFETFDTETLQGSRPELAGAGQVNVSAHFLVDRDGTIMRLMPETWMARHCIGLNYSAIGIENVGGRNGEADLTDRQVAANIWLVRYLRNKHASIEYLIGHYEYMLFENHPLFLEVDPSYRTKKTDPGEQFMHAVRKGVADLALLGPPE
ncbi:MAG: N-acetylmuramoyl-L-alanine amidase [Rhodothermales bacterium]|nr:N-acetylmuramoyl-L-alanine amidase [Rhodothermales bacterium]